MPLLNIVVRGEREQRKKDTKGGSRWSSKMEEEKCELRKTEGNAEGKSQGSFWFTAQLCQLFSLCTQVYSAVKGRWNN